MGRYILTIARLLLIWKKPSDCCMKLRPVLARLMRRMSGLHYLHISGKGMLGGMIKLLSE